MILLLGIWSPCQPKGNRNWERGISWEANIRLDRRQNHISKIDPKAIALDYPNDKDSERPSAEDLCGRVASLKQNCKYHESVKAREDQNHEIALREVPVPQQNISSEQIERLQAKIQAQETVLEESSRTMAHKDETIAAGQPEIEKLKEQYRREIDEERKVKNKEISELTDALVNLNSDSWSGRRVTFVVINNRYCPAVREQKARSALN